MWNIKKGFTLVELLVVIALIGVLGTSTVMISIGQNINRANDNKRKADLESIRSALELYRSDVGNYPCGITLQAALVPTYMNAIPTDPKAPTYSYAYAGLPDCTVPANTRRYCLEAFMEVASDIVTIPASCGAAFSCTGASCNYYVAEP